MTLADRADTAGKASGRGKPGGEAARHSEPMGEGMTGRLSSILRLAAEVEARGKGVPPKREEELADLLIMSTLDQKAPAPADGSGDLLDALVENHLARGEAAPPPGEAPAAEATQEMQEEGGQQGQDLDAEEGVLLLQKEIETLLRGDAVAVVEAVHLQSAAEKPGSDPGQRSDPMAMADDAATMTPAELETLLAPAAAIPTGQEKPQIHEVAETPREDDETSRQLSEAEGVLAAELAQLMAESEQLTKSEVPVPEAAPPVPLVAQEAPAPPQVAALSPQAAKVPPEMPPPVVVELPETDGECEAAALPRQGIVARVREFVGNLVLLLAQLIDMPFAWMDELDKNVLGVVAFVLLLSGCIMYWLATLYR